MSVHIVPGVDADLTDAQVRIVEEGFVATADSVPTLDARRFEAHLLIDDGIPIGAFMVAPFEHIESAVEVGARVWKPNSRVGFLFARWLGNLLTDYENVVARCYANNMTARRSLQRLGFVLLRVDHVAGRSIHSYACNRVAFNRLISQRYGNDEAVYAR